MLLNILFAILFLWQFFHFVTWSMAFYEIGNVKEFNFQYFLAFCSGIWILNALLIQNNYFLIFGSIYILGLFREIDEARYFLTFPKGKAKYLFATILWPIEYFVDQESPMRKELNEE